MAPSLYIFRGIFYPIQIESGHSITTDLDLPVGKIQLRIEGNNVSLELITEAESFEQLVRYIDDTMKSFMAAQALRSLVFLQIIWQEWVEQPLDMSKGAKNIPVRGKFLQPSAEQMTLPGETLIATVTSGMEFYKEIESNPFLRRAVLDYGYALQQPVSEVPIYLYRSLESIKQFFGSWKEMKSRLRITSGLDEVKRISNDAEQGLHVRHASKKEENVTLATDEVEKAIRETAEIITRFKNEIWSAGLNSQPADH